MTPHRAKAARACDAAALGNVTGWLASDFRVNSASILDLQRAWLASRFGVPADRARVLAELAFPVNRRRA
jgi:hypothetical protein